MTRRTTQLLTAFALCLPITGPIVGVPQDYPCTGPGPGGTEVCHNGPHLNGLMANGLQVIVANTKPGQVAGARLVALGGRLTIE